VTTRMPLVPEFEDGKVKRFLEQQSTFIAKELDKRTPDVTVRQSVFLQSPDKSVWEVAVDDTGTLTTTKVLG